MTQLLVLVARSAVTLIFALVLFYFVISVCVLLFKATGVLGEGPMYFDFHTPSYGALILFQFACVVVLLGAAWLRNKLLTVAPRRHAAPN
jgi:hypothetical protein